MSIEGLKAECTRRFDHIEGLKAECTRRFDHIEGLKAECTRRFDHIEGLKAECTRRFDHIEGLKAECTRRFDHESVALPLSHPCFPLWPNEFEELTRRTRSGLNACMSGASKDHGRSAHDLSIRSRSLYHWAIIISLLPSLTKGVWRRRKNASVYERSMEARL